MAFNGVATIGMPQQSGGGGLVGCSPVNPNSCNQSALISVNTMPNNNAGGQPTVVLLSTPSPQHQVQQQQVSQQQQQSMGPGNGPLLVCTPNMQQQQQSLSNNNNNNMMHQNQNGGVGSNISTIGGGGNNTMIIDGPHNNKRLCTRMDNNNDSGHINQNNTVSTITTTTTPTLTTLPTLPHVHPPASQPFSLQSSSPSPASPLLSSVDLHSSRFQFNHPASIASSSTGAGGECSVQEGTHNVIMRDTTHPQSTRILSIDGSSSNHSNANISNYSSSLICDCLTSHHPHHHHPNISHHSAHPHPHTMSLSLITAKNNDHDYTRYPDDGDYNNVIKCCSPSDDEALHPQQQQLLQGNVSASCSTSSPLLSSTLIAAGHRVTGQMMASQVSNLD